MNKQQFIEKSKNNLRDIFKKVWSAEDIEVFFDSKLSECWDMAGIEMLKKIDPIDLIQPCKPDCTPKEHAYHQGTWMAHLKLDGILISLTSKQEDK